MVAAPTRTGGGRHPGIDQALVPGKHSGYVVYNAFDTGTVNNDPDIDPDQTGVNLEAAGDDVDKSDIVVCISDHEDSGQNEPYEQAADGEVAAKNRPIIQPTLAALGVSAIEPLNTYKLGLGYSIERWYAPHMIADAPPFTLALTDPQGFLKDADGIFTHVFVKTRAEQPGVRRINDIDDFGEQFADPHSERSDHGQPEVFNVNGDAQAYLHNSVTAPDGSGRGPLGLLTFSTEGDLPISWTVKASLAPESYSREVDLTDDEFRAWERSWQAYYCGGPKPTMPLAPGTNAPAPRPSTCVVNPPPAPPPATVTNNTTIIQSTPAATVSNRCISGRSVRLALSKKARKGAIRYVGAKGVRTVKARRANGRLRATADFRGVSAESGTYAAVSVREKMKKGGWRERSLLLKLC
ncbi:MAG TPA: hypothetical protein VNO82_17910 [Solirubrobacteraceae bacterium]|nr:hypothetical protein [Solirubrobacteraceae bacterium]